MCACHAKTGKHGNKAIEAKFVVFPINMQYAQTYVFKNIFLQVLGFFALRKVTHSPPFIWKANCKTTINIETK